MLEFVQTFAVRIMVIVVFFIFFSQIIKMIGWVWNSKFVCAFLQSCKDGGKRFASVHPACRSIVDGIERCGELCEISYRGFHGIGYNDVLEDAGKKVRANFVRGLIHDVADYSLAIVCFIMVSMLNDLHMSFLWIFLAVWVYDIGCCLSLMRMCATAKDDIVCGINHRNAYENLCIASETAGFLYKYAFLFPVAIIWNGPVQLVYFYKKEWDTVSRSAFAIIVMTMLQGLFWAYIYTVGHNGMIARIIEYFG